MLVANLSARQGSVAVSVRAGRWRKLIDSAAPKWRGAGSALPDELDGGREHRLTLAPRSLALFDCAIVRMK